MVEDSAVQNRKSGKTKVFRSRSLWAREKHNENWPETIFWSVVQSATADWPSQCVEVDRDIDWNETLSPALQAATMCRPFELSSMPRIARHHLSTFTVCISDWGWTWCFAVSLWMLGRRKLTSADHRLAYSCRRTCSRNCRTNTFCSDVVWNFLWSTFHWVGQFPTGPKISTKLSLGIRKRKDEKQRWIQRHSSVGCTIHTHARDRLESETDD